jgi:hypothetical protein
VVTKLGKYVDGEDGSSCYPTVVFVVGGTNYAAHGGDHSDRCPWTLNRSATVHYSPADPTDADVVPTDWLGLRLLVPLGVVGAGLVLWARPGQWAGRRAAPTAGAVE